MYGVYTYGTIAYASLRTTGSFDQTVEAGLAVGSWTAYSSGASTTVTIAAGLAVGSWTALGSSSSTTVTVTAGLAVGTWTVYDSAVPGGGQTITAGLASGNWIVYPAVSLAGLPSGPSDDAAVAIPAEVQEFPFEIPFFSQGTLREQKLLASWNSALVEWWNEVRKRLHRKTITLNLEDLTSRVEILETTPRPKNIIKRFYRASNLWRYEHGREMKPAVSVNILFQDYYAADFEQIDVPGVTEIRWGSNYEGEALYIFPD